MLPCCSEESHWSPIPPWGETMASTGDRVSSNSHKSLFQAALPFLWAFCFLMSKLNTHLSAIVPSHTFCYHWEEFASGVIIAPHHEVIGCCLTAFGLLFIRLHKPSSSASPQWSCALDPDHPGSPSLCLSPVSWHPHWSGWPKLCSFP